MSFNSQAWIAIALAIIATFMWRFLGVLIYKKVNSESVLMRLINMLAYSLLGSVMMMLMILLGDGKGEASDLRSILYQGAHQVSRIMNSPSVLFEHRFT